MTNVLDLHSDGVRGVFITLYICISGNEDNMQKMQELVKQGLDDRISPFVPECSNRSSLFHIDQTL